MVIGPFFTIVTASLNSGSTIGTTLMSVAGQSFGSLEHIVMDGGSSDETVSILREFEKGYELKWKSEADSGIANALNKGLQLANGRYILVLQADDRLAGPEVLDRVYRLLKGEVYDICSFPVILDEPSGGKILYEPVKILWWHHFKTIFPHQGAFVHKRVYERIGNFREELTIAFDYDFFYRALKSRCTVRFEEGDVAIMGGKGISSNKNLLARRLKEESRVQSLNETDPIWKAMQFLFRTLYVPYKTRLVPFLQNSFRKQG